MLIIPGNIENSLVIPTWELTENVAAIFLLIYTANHAGVN